eukprot:TRINITY_DN66668_c4_g1_i2.p1 TRINITY_DN66668_c4_g1~~TRINITY_DN66668_c4_g1_i2.p1  ORF type:complete len:311 (+),score=-5.16 TRINITY_DN66668_c4_g1_i2:173-1105(+)
MLHKIECTLKRLKELGLVQSSLPPVLVAMVVNMLCAAIALARFSIAAVLVLLGSNYLLAVMLEWIELPLGDGKLPKFISRNAKNVYAVLAVLMFLIAPLGAPSGLLLMLATVWFKVLTRLGVSPPPCPIPRVTRTCVIMRPLKEEYSLEWDEHMYQASLHADDMATILSELGWALPPPLTAGELDGKETQKFGYSVQRFKIRAKTLTPTYCAVANFISAYSVLMALDVIRQHLDTTLVSWRVYGEQLNADGTIEPVVIQQESLLEAIHSVQRVANSYWDQVTNAESSEIENIGISCDHIAERMKNGWELF